MGVGWQIWVIRFAISMVGATVLAFVVSFRVADYVLEAHSSTLSNTLGSLQSSVDRLNDSVLENTAAIMNLHELMSDLRADSRDQARVLMVLQEDVTKLQQAVQESGVDIKVGSTGEGKSVDWSAIRAAVGAANDEPVFLELKAN